VPTLRDQSDGVQRDRNEEPHNKNGEGSEHVGAERTTWGLVGPTGPWRERQKEMPSVMGMIISVRVSFTTMAVDAAPWPKTDPAATTDDMSLMAVPPTDRNREGSSRGCGPGWETSGQRRC